MSTKRIVCITPFESPDVVLAHALIQAGATGVLDLGKDFEIGIQALSAMKLRGVRSFGVRFSPLLYEPKNIPEDVNLIVFDAQDFLENRASLENWKRAGREIWLQVCSRIEAQNAWLKNPDGLILKGFESGGRVGNDSSFILLQEIVSFQIPFWVQGGIGLHSAAGCFFAGAQGVVLDAQLSLLKESSISEEIKKTIVYMDGTDTKKINNTPVGSDICLARRISEKYSNARAFVHSLKRSVEGHLRQAKKFSSLKPLSPMAQANGTEFPLAQGPMTRVSDKSEFIHAVSKNGALAFLALSLMNKNQAREILQETSDIMKEQDLPWGVGILGFVPEELQKEQFEVLSEFNPSAVLIAGGRYSQTIPFEKRGIRTFLHVPSPGLLKQFLKDGARRFVFEGRECGGHVGPRGSFVLWENQIDTLLDFGALDDVEVFFAGGIHDALSGAILAVMAAPIVARGAKIGALIGTAYLFTKEAVETGAILQRFQHEAINCKQTALLETSPGHATRCALTPFVEKFENKKKDLQLAGFESKEIWAELEKFNVGKLRIASKGIERVSDQLVSVDENRQREEGLFMLGQVAQLRSGVCTMMNLHKEICEGACALLEKSKIHSANKKKPVDIAIIGMACIFPGAKNLEEYWHNILIGKNAITEVPQNRWNRETYFEENTNNPAKSISKWGAFIDEFEFDAMEYGIPPNSIASIEPVQLLSLKVAKDALADAGYLDKEFDREKTSVIFGAESGSDLSAAYGFRTLFPQYIGKIPKELQDSLPELTEESFPGVLANVITGRIANRLDLGGSNYTVDAACASSLAALDLAVKELVHGESDMVLCGGADLHNSINDYLMFSSVHALSPTGKSQPFSAHANGIVLGEGIAVVVLKRLQDAIADNDRIYCVVKAVGSSSDGKSLGLTAPRKEGQMRALQRAYEQASVSPSEIELIEAHGTGTVVGDRTELETMTDIFSESGALMRSCALGSVKSQIGHTKCAAGLAGLIKTSLAIYHEIIPPTLNLEHPNPYYQPNASPFFFTQTPLPWMSQIRHAAVSAFGFGGTNFHTVLASYQNTEMQTDRMFNTPRLWSDELFLFEKKSAVKELSEIIEKNPNLDFARLAKTVSLRDPKNVIVSIVAKNLQDLSVKLNKALKDEKEKGIFYAQPSVNVDGRCSKIAFLFSGQGSQRVNMGAEIFSVFPHLKQYLEYGKKWASCIFPNGVHQESEKKLKKTSVAQPALGIIDLAFYHLTQDFGIVPDFLGGHSYGELVAFCAAGGISVADLLSLSEARGLAMEKAAHGKNGSMAAVFADPEVVYSIVSKHKVVIANLNSPFQTVISGQDSDIEIVTKKFVQDGIRCSKIPVSCAFHSPLMQGAEKEFFAAFSKIKINIPSKIIYSNTTGKPHETFDEILQAHNYFQNVFARQMIEPVQFVKQIEEMYENGARIFIEVGPGGVLKKLIGEILIGKPHYVQTFDRVGEKSDKYGSAIEQILFTLAELSSMGVRINPDILFSGRNLQPYNFENLNLDTQATQQRSTMFLINGHVARPKYATESKALPKKITPISLSFADGRENLVKDYLISMRQIVEGQRQVMLEFLGQSQRFANDSHNIQDTQFTQSTQFTQPTQSSPVVLNASKDAVLESGRQQKLNVKDVVLKIVSQKTGYPEEMMGLDQDLEADLSIGSIKRFEIIAEIGEQLGLSNQSDGANSLEKLASTTTLRRLIDLLEVFISSADDLSSRGDVSSRGLTAGTSDFMDPAVKPRDDTSPRDDAQLLDDTTFPMNRYSFQSIEAPLNTFQSKSLKNISIGIIEDKKGLSKKLAHLFSQAGAKVLFIKHETLWDSISTPLYCLVLMSLFDADGPKTIEVFNTLQHATRHSTQSIIGVTAHGGTFHLHNAHLINRKLLGVSGLFKSIAKEYPDKHIKIIDLDPTDPHDQIVQKVFNEVQFSDLLIEIGYEKGIRKQLVPCPYMPNFVQQKNLQLDKNSTILMLGGARGIGAKIAIKLAKEYGCKFEIIGRSKIEINESLDTRHIPDLQGLRNYFIKQGKSKTPAEIEFLCKQILNNRDIQKTLETLEQFGNKPNYHSFDVRDKKCLEAFIDDLYAKGTIDGVIHAAGILSDSRFLDKSEETFAKVFETKVNPAEVLTERLREDVKFVAFFSSVSGCFGNSGQTDYSAANSALDSIAHIINERIQGRAISFNWGPWAETGMVTPELKNEYRKKGIGLIPPDLGSEHFFNELIFGHSTTQQVVIMSGTAEKFN